MMLSPEHKAHIEQRFDAFCKTVMKFEARNCYRAIKRKQKHEVSLNYLMEEYNFELPSMDGCFVIQSMQEPPTHFHISGQIVAVENERLAAALSQLPEEKRTWILLRYFVGINDTKIAAMYGIPRRTVNYHKHRTLKRLRQEMERLAYEET